MTKKLGLPFEYKKFPQFFDAQNILDNSAEKNIFLEKILKKYQVKTIADMTCGTGSQVFFLNQLGYQIIGSDFSPALLEIARNKAKDKKLKLKFIDGDMRQIRLGEFDCVITIFNAIGHLTKKSFAKALKNIAKNLKNNGIYIFDIFNLEALNDKVVKDFAMEIKKKSQHSEIHNIQYSTIDRTNGLLTSYNKSILYSNNKKPKVFKNKFSLQIYNACEIAEILNQNGFEVLEQLDFDGGKFSKSKTVNMLTVARKI